MSEQKLSDRPELVALCRQDDDGQEEIAGWAMVLADQVVGYVPSRSGTGGTSYSFESLESAEWLLSYSDIYPVRQLATG